MRLRAQNFLTINHFYMAGNYSSSQVEQVFNPVYFVYIIFSQSCIFQLSVAVNRAMQLTYNKLENVQDIQ